ncbi:MAG: translation elongation factor Ts [Pseudomonadota bacterium]|nr:translation elongation factor Ts [Pseudomonadota bacterium]
MTITAAMVKELREVSGAGMMDCKKALQEADGNLETAIEHLRKSGIAKAANKAGRTAAEGIVLIKENDNQVVLLEVNCETDFVENDKNFTDFSVAVADIILQSDPKDLDELRSCETNKGSVEEASSELSAKVGEKIDVRRFILLDKKDGLAGTYIHGKRIGVVVLIDSGDRLAAKDVAMHVAATNPLAIDSNGIPERILEKEREIHRSQANETGKPPEIVEKMIFGRMKKFVAENTLLGQTFVKNNDLTVAKFLEESGVKVSAFYRYEVGEGIEKKTLDFAEEVAAQAQQSKKLEHPVS